MIRIDTDFYKILGQKFGLPSQICGKSEYSAARMCGIVQCGDDRSISLVFQNVIRMQPQVIWCQDRGCCGTGGLHAERHPCPGRPCRLCFMWWDAWWSSHRSLPYSCCGGRQMMRVGGLHPMQTGRGGWPLQCIPVRRQLRFHRYRGCRKSQTSVLGY